MSQPVSAGRPRAAACFADCLRRCDSCRVGYSNGRSRPTLIHEDPLDNLPSPLRPGARELLDQAINVDNRSNKLAKFGFSSSEDAVTWSVFVGLQRSVPELLVPLYGHLFGLSPEAPPALVLWGAAVDQDPRGEAVVGDLLAISDRLGERSRSRSEPDVVLDFGDAGLVIIEVKYRSGNDHRQRANWDPYLRDTKAFSVPEQARSSGLYELLRNWRIAHDLAGSRPFVLVNLAPERVLAKTPGMASFEASLGAPGRGRFLRLSWAEFLTGIDGFSASLPAWWASYIEGRSLRV